MILCPVAGPFHIGLMFREGADAGDAQNFLKFFEELVVVPPGVVDRGRQRGMAIGCGRHE
jgi:hypothetical protein